MGHGESQITIWFSTSDGGYGPGPTMTTVSGYPATYQEVRVTPEDRKHPDCGGNKCVQRVWIVEINDTPVTITVDPGPMATAANLAEARAVIDSLRVERANSSTGFKLSFDLPAGWGAF